MSNNETETQIRLRRSIETLESAREAERNARKQLIECGESVKRAKERYEELFEKEEREEIARRKANYNHQTN